MDEAEIAVLVCHPLLAAELLIYLQGFEEHFLGFVEIAAGSMDEAEIAVLVCHPLLAAELLIYLQGFEEHLLGFVEIAAGSMDEAEIAGCHGNCCFVSVSVSKRQNLIVGTFRYRQIAYALLQDAQPGPTIGIIRIEFSGLGIGPERLLCIVQKRQ